MADAHEYPPVPGAVPQSERDAHPNATRPIEPSMSQVPPTPSASSDLPFLLRQPKGASGDAAWGSGADDSTAPPSSIVGFTSNRQSISVTRTDAQAAVAEAEAARLAAMRAMGKVDRDSSLSGFASALPPAPIQPLEHTSKERDPAEMQRIAALYSLSGTATPVLPSVGSVPLSIGASATQQIAAAAPMSTRPTVNAAESLPAASFSSSRGMSGASVVASAAVSATVPAQLPGVQSPPEPSDALDSSAPAFVSAGAAPTEVNAAEFDDHLALLLHNFKKGDMSRAFDTPMSYGSSESFRLAQVALIEAQRPDEQDAKISANIVDLKDTIGDLVTIARTIHTNIVSPAASNTNLGSVANIRLGLSSSMLAGSTTDVGLPTIPGSTVNVTVTGPESGMQLAADSMLNIAGAEGEGGTALAAPLGRLATRIRVGVERMLDLLVDIETQRTAAAAQRDRLASLLLACSIETMKIHNERVRLEQLLRRKTDEVRALGTANQELGKEIAQAKFRSERAVLQFHNDKRSVESRMSKLAKEVESERKRRTQLEEQLESERRDRRRLQQTLQREMTRIPGEQAVQGAVPVPVPAQFLQSPLQWFAASDIVKRSEKLEAECIHLREEARRAQAEVAAVRRREVVLQEEVRILKAKVVSAEARLGETTKTIERAEERARTLEQSLVRTAASAVRRKREEEKVRNAEKWLATIPVLQRRMETLRARELQAQQAEESRTHRTVEATRSFRSQGSMPRQAKGARSGNASGSASPVPHPLPPGLRLSRVDHASLGGADGSIVGDVGAPSIAVSEDGGAVVTSQPAVVQ